MYIMQTIVLFISQQQYAALVRGYAWVSVLRLLWSSSSSRTVPSSVCSTPRALPSVADRLRGGGVLAVLHVPCIFSGFFLGGGGGVARW